jgi:hypothetical protein
MRQITTGSDPHGDSRKPVRLTARLQRAEKSSVFSELHCGQTQFRRMHRETKCFRNSFQIQVPRLVLKMSASASPSLPENDHPIIMPGPDGSAPS